MTRKNIAATSELSMFKAILFRLEKTKEEKEKLYIEAENRLSLGKAPFDDCERKWKTQVDLENHRSEYIEKRKRIYREKEELGTVMPLRHKPEERPVLYQDDKTGLFKAYGSFAPFRNLPKPNNLRHFRNPKAK